MEQGFIDILKQLVEEQVNAVMLDSKQFKSVLTDYTKNEYKKESRFLIQAVEAGVAKAIKETDNLPACKRGKIRELVEDYGLSPEVSAAIVDTLALVLRGDTSKSETQTETKTEKPQVEKSAASQPAPKLEGGSYKIEVNVSFRDHRGGGMKVECINPFAKSFSYVSETVINCKAKRCNVYLQSAAKPVTGVTAWIGFTGDIEGRLLLTMSKETALYAASAMNGETLTVFDDLVKATIEELVNMTAGVAKNKLNEIGIKIGSITKPSFFDDGYTEKDANLVDKDAMVMPFEVTK